MKKATLCVMWVEEGEVEALLGNFYALPEARITHTFHE